MTGCTVFCVKSVRKWKTDAFLGSTCALPGPTKQASPAVSLHRQTQTSSTLVTSILLWNLLAVELEEFLLVVQSWSHVFRGFFLSAEKFNIKVQVQNYVCL